MASAWAFRWELLVVVLILDIVELGELMDEVLPMDAWGSLPGTDSESTEGRISSSSSSTNVLPFPMVEMQWTWPFMSSARLRQMLSPRPDPPYLPTRCCPMA